MIINDSLLEQIIEGALMSSGQTLSVERIQSLFDEGDEPKQQRILIAIERISEKCQHRGFELKKVATGYRFQVKQNISQWIGRLWDEKPQRYSRALLETLSIIAYRQPVTRGEIESVRGVAVSSHITKTLVEREWIQVVGHRDVPGRPAMFATTKMFLDYFNLESLDQLPTLEEITDITDANHALVLEEKVEEGNFDFSSKESEDKGDDTLASAAKDLAEADALVQAVEDAVFNKPAEEQTELELSDAEVTPAAPIESLSSIELAEAYISDAQSELSNEQLEEEGSKLEEELVVEELDEEAIAEATIARMIAEQEALINEKAGAPSKLKGKVEPIKASKSTSVFADFANAADSNSDLANDAPQSAEVEVVKKPTSVFDSFQNDDAMSYEFQSEMKSSVMNESQSASQDSTVDQPLVTPSNTDEDDDIMAAMEDELMAQLEAEQEALLTEQADQDENSDTKTLADLASKFE
jgi:segregation and condensation protein B